MSEETAERLVTICSYSTPYEANMVKSQLEAAGIPAFVADEYTIGANWLYSNALGGVKVQVPAFLVHEAQLLLAAEPESPVPDEPAAEVCPACGSSNTETFLNKRSSFLTWLLLGFPLLLPSERKRCHDCGHEWRPA